MRTLFSYFYFFFTVLHVFLQISMHKRVPKLLLCVQVYGIFDERCPTSSGYGRPEEHLPYVVLEHCPCTDLFSFLVTTDRRD